jgi:hypothetical protein
METVTTGPFMMRSTCRRCHGKGSWNKNPCNECRGAGQTKQRKKIVVPVPAGIEDGQVADVLIFFLIRKKLAFLLETKLISAKNIVALAFDNNAIFRLKLAKIAENCDHNIDCRWQTKSFRIKSFFTNNGGIEKL